MKLSAKVTVMQGRTLKARGAASYRAAAGTYSVTSAATYRSETPYRAYKTVAAEADAESCRVTAATVDLTTIERPWGGSYVTYTATSTGTCIGSGYDANGSHTGTFTGQWTSEVCVHGHGQRLPANPERRGGLHCLLPRNHGQGELEDRLHGLPIRRGQVGVNPAHRRRQGQHSSGTAHQQLHAGVQPVPARLSPISTARISMAV